MCVCVPVQGKGNGLKNTLQIEDATKLNESMQREHQRGKKENRTGKGKKQDHNPLN